MATTGSAPPLLSVADFNASIVSLITDEGEEKAPRFDRFSSLDDYVRFREDNAHVFRRRRAIESLLAHSQKPFMFTGFNALVDRHVRYAVDYLHSYEEVDGLKIPNYRECLECSETGMKSRWRASLLALQSLAGRSALSNARIYLTEQMSGLYGYLRRQNPATVGSEYLGSVVPLGSEKDGLRNEDVTRLTFGDGRFDFVLCNDVLEHVPEHLPALAELSRVLRPGGTLILTVPFASGRHEHVVRATIGSNCAIVHHMPPEYHGDPINPQNGALCYRYFGWQLLDELRDSGFEADVLSYWSLYHGVIGDQGLLMFHAQKKSGR